MQHFKLIGERPDGPPFDVKAVNAPKGVEDRVADALGRFAVAHPALIESDFFRLGVLIEPDIRHYVIVSFRFAASMPVPRGGSSCEADRVAPEKTSNSMFGPLMSDSGLGENDGVHRFLFYAKGGAALDEMTVDLMMRLERGLDQFKDVMGRDFRRMLDGPKGADGSAGLYRDALDELERF